MREVKVNIITGPTNVSLRQLPSGRPYIERNGRRYIFDINGAREADIVVVRNKNVRETTEVTATEGGVILMTSEPESVVNYPKQYCDQFDIVYTSQKEITHHNLVTGPPLLPWFVGVETHNGKSEYTMRYEEIVNADTSVKTKNISVITSDKAFTAGHRARLRFVKKLKDALGEEIDIFGRGFREIGDKWQALLPYRYHIAIENCAADDYWTEKLSDAFLAGCHPIYYGCKNIEKYFDQQSMSTIDINDEEKAIDTIRKIAREDKYQSVLPYTQESRERCIGKYNMFSIIADICDKVDIDKERVRKRLNPAKTLGSNITRYCIGRPIQKILYQAEKALGKTLK